MTTMILRHFVIVWMVLLGGSACGYQIVTVAATATDTDIDTDNSDTTNSHPGAVSDNDTDADMEYDGDTNIDIVNETNIESDNDAETSLKELCENTHGRWDTSSCGSYHCGIRPDCETVIPGCNCGLGWVFDEHEGCIASDECPSCPDPGDPTVDYVRHSYLNPAACDLIDYQCEDDKYISYLCGCGCIKSEAQLRCDDTGGEWIYMSCGDWYCGEMRDCDVVVPGCNCGADKKVDPDTLECVAAAECIALR